MITNYFRLKRAPLWTLHEYHVEFQPQCDSKAMMKAMLRKNKDKLGAYIFDGMKMYNSRPLEPSPFIFQQEMTEGTFTVKIKYHGPVEPGDPTYMHFYNLILRTCLFGMGLEEMGRNFYDHTAAICLNAHRLTLWPGFITSLRQHENDVLLCVETTHKVLRLDNVLATIRTIQQGARGGNAEEAIKAQLLDTIVMTAYNRKTYRIADIDFKTTPSCTFETKARDGTISQISYVEYYQNRYNQTITDLKQPMLVAKPGKKDLHRGEDQLINLIPELCQLTGLTDQMRENFTLMKELSKYLHVGPQERVKEITHFMDRLSSKISDSQVPLGESLKNWGLEFERKLSPVKGRTLGSEKIVFASGEELADNKGDWTKAFRNQKMLTTVNLERWVVIVPQRDAPGVDNLTRTMSKVSAPLNMRIGNPLEVYKLADIKGTSYVKAINDLVAKHQDLQMLFVILPNNKPEPYGAVKKRLAVDQGIPSQCFVSRNVTSKGLMSIATKVVVQMNAKLGGEPWSIKIPLKKLMVVGFDVYHGAKGSKGGSVGAMVATITPTLAKYFSTTSVFNGPDEFSKVLLSDFTKCLHTFAEERDQGLPERIVFYRDGVGDGQLGQVLTQELVQLQEALNQVYVHAGLPLPKFTLIVVTKKINSRVMLDRGGKYDNPAPGTVVDDVITLPERYDFFLISCAARQGTVSPCCYNVMYDSQGLDPDKMQMLTYKMCHMYFNWSGTVAVPAPCQYAHKLAFITGMSYGGAANKRLSKYLHFL